MSDPKESKTILVVENDPVIRETLGEILKRFGHRVLLVDRASSALAELEKGIIDAMLLDIHLPGPYGHHMLSFLRRHNRTVPPTIVVSAYIKREVIDELLRLGVCGILAKPFHVQRLREELDRALGQEVQRPSGHFCSGCGNPLNINDLYCRTCGRSIDVSRICSRCFYACDAKDSFCGRCGMGLEQPDMGRSLLRNEG